jgi:putative DNA primase/helicase
MKTYDLRAEILRANENGTTENLRSLLMFVTTHPKAKNLNGSPLWGAIEDHWDDYPDGKSEDERDDKDRLWKLWRAAKELERENNQQSIDECGLLRKADGKLVPCLANAIQLLKSSERFVAMLGYNELTMFPVKLKPAPWDEAEKWNGPKEWTDLDDVKLTEHFQRHDLAIDHVSKVAAAANSVARENPFHPVQKYLGSLEWDQQPRVQTWLSDYLGAEANAYTRAVGSAWLISAVARVEQPGCQADYTLLLQGAQGTLKSSAIRALVGDEFFGDNSADITNKDTLLMIHRNWVVELAELAGARRSEVNRVKAFLTCRHDQFRAPYDRRPQTYPRMNVFAASINDDEPFVDETGNRRFWPVKCGAILIEKLKADRDQLWAEAFALYEDGRPWWLEEAQLELLATEEQSKRYQHGVWDAAIEDWLENPQRRLVENWEKDGDGKNVKTLTPLEPYYSSHNKVTVGDILLHAVAKDLDRQTQSDSNAVARCLKHNGWIRVQKRDGNMKRKYYLRPGTVIDEDERGNG